MPLLFVVDDNQDVCRMMVRMLHLLGYEVEVFTSGAELLNYLGAASSVLPDLFILDYMMPEMDGCELLSRIRVTPRVSRTPAVFYTANDDDAVFARMRSCGADDLWIKSRIDLATIEANVRRLLLASASGQGRGEFYFRPDQQPLVAPDQDRNQPQ